MNTPKSYTLIFIVCLHTESNIFVEKSNLVHVFIVDSTYINAAINKSRAVVDLHISTGTLGCYRIKPKRTWWGYGVSRCVILPLKIPDIQCKKIQTPANSLWFFLSPLESSYVFDTTRHSMYSTSLFGYCLFKQPIFFSPYLIAMRMKTFFLHKITNLS